DSSKGPGYRRLVLIFGKFYSVTFAMARPKVTGINQSPRKGARGIVINEGAAPSRKSPAKLPLTWGKVKGRVSYNPHQRRGAPTARAYMSLTSLPLIVRIIQRIAMHDSDQIPVPLTPPPPPALVVESVPPPIQASPPQSLNRLKVEGLRTILEEKHLSTNGVVDRYPEKFYSSYEELVPKGKKKASAFKPVDYVVVLGKKSKCICIEINEVLDCTMDVVHYYIDLIQKKTIDDLKGWLAPLISNTTPRWIEVGVPIEKKNLNMAAIYWRAYVLVIAKTDVEVTLTSSIDIRRLEFSTYASSGASTIPPPTTIIVAASSRPHIIQAMLYEMGHLAQSADVRASQVEVVMPGLIERTIDASLALIRA
ncbi:hypothetical protein MTR67_040063, partial [Solanum verrucosum]